MIYKLVEIAKVFDVSVDFLIGEGQLSTYDKQVLKRIEDIEGLPEEDKKHLFYLIDNLVKASKLKAYKITVEAPLSSKASPL